MAVGRAWAGSLRLLSEAAVVLSRDARQQLGRREKRQLYVHGKKAWSPSDALQHVRNCTWSKIDETLEIVFKLNIDPRQADQNLRGAIDMPHGVGKKVRVAVFARGDKAEEAMRAGATFAGAEELIDSVQKNKPAFDRGVATPDMMGLVGRVGKILGPKKLMPTPKTGTVTFEIEDIVQRISQGRHIQFRTDPHGYIPVGIGKLSAGDDALLENLRAAVNALIGMKPASIRRKYILGAVMSSSMGPGVHVTVEGLTSLVADRPK